MVLLALQFKADLENITNVSLEESVLFAVKVKCSNCQESKDVVISPTDEFAIEGSRGTCQFRMKCKMCERIGSIAITEKDGKDKSKKSTPKADDPEEASEEDASSDEKSKKKSSKKIAKSSKKKPLQDAIKARFTYVKKASGTFATVVIMDCRGLEVVSWEPKVGWSATGVNTSTKFNDINLAEDFFDYDEESSKEVYIQAIETKVVKA